MRAEPAYSDESWFLRRRAPPSQALIGKRAEALPGEQPDLPLEGDGDGQDDEEAAERHPEADRQAEHREHDGDDEADDQEHEAVPGDPVAAGRERRVLLEVLLDLAEDPLFVLGERHRHHHHTFEAISQRASALGGWSRVYFPAASAF